MKANPIPVTDTVLLPYKEKIIENYPSAKVVQDKNGKDKLDFGTIPFEDCTDVQDVTMTYSPDTIVRLVNSAARIEARSEFMASVRASLGIEKGKAVVLGSAGLLKAYDSAVASKQWKGDFETFKALFGK